MRYLNKIIFIHSAHIPYAEIKLDGNVHFIGTQGVGKSTLLRAILFFYNADKNKLGIQREQKSFDDFYLPTPDAYIIYEVNRDNGQYFVMSFISKGRCAFRFVDCKYDKRFFMDDNLNVDYEWGKINQKIGPKVFKSNIIRSYSDFRDVIYGNSHDRELRRFSIMESQKYENVPRTIQNIFLNQSLESRMIKNTIIDSMDFADDNIDLNFFREHLKDFKQKYEDIWKWYKKESNGQVKVKIDADKVIDGYTSYEETLRAINELCAQLNYAYERDKNLLPAIQSTINEKDTLLKNEIKRLSEEIKKFEEEQKKLYREEGEMNALVKRTRDRRQHYQEINIDAIIRRSTHEGELRICQSSTQKQMNSLTDKNRDIKVKYEELKRENDFLLQQSRHESQERITTLEGYFIKAVQARQEVANTKREVVRKRFLKQFASLEEKLQAAGKEVFDLKLKRLKVETMNPFEAEMNENKDNRKKLQNRRHEIEFSAVLLQKEIDGILSNTALKRKEMEMAYEGDVSRIKHDIKRLEESAKELQELLDSQKGSLIEWLGENMNGWERNIGKVLDEKSVLYNTAVYPQKLAFADNVYGVQLQLDNIDREVRTPHDIEKEKQLLEQRIVNQRKAITERKARFDSDVQELERKPAKHIKELRVDKANTEAEARIIPQRIEALAKDFELLSDKLNSFRRKETETIDGQIGKAQLQQEELERCKESLSEQENAEIGKVQKEFNAQQHALKKARDLNISLIEEEFVAKKADKEKKYHELEAQMDAELKGVGVNVNILNSLRRELHEIELELNYIEQHRKDVAGWENDMRELFDHEQENKDCQKTLRLKIDDLNNKFKIRHEKLDTTIQGIRNDLDQNNKQLERLNESIADVDGFKASSSCPTNLGDISGIPTVKTLKEIHRALSDEISSKQEKMESLKRTVNIFKSIFLAQNTFHFHTDFNLETDYLDFAVDLNEFVGDQKIEEYRVRTSEEYASILQRISREVNNLMNHKSDIEGTIGDINKDFKENNFTGVIKNIELRASESNDQLMQLMFNIHKFANEHTHDIGEMNLFSDEDVRKKINEMAVNLLMTLIDQLDAEKKRDVITLTDIFKLEFKVKENDQETEWTEKLTHVGSDGTDILVKAMVNIMLINVFKRKVCRKFGDFRLHCMMDEIGKLHPDNVRGILDFGNKRNILLINSSPTTYNAEAYRYTYSLSKDEYSNTVVKSLLTIR
jgi:hypothetical protein